VVILINKGLEREEGEENLIVEWIGRVWPLESQEKILLLLLFKTVHLCSPVIFHYRLKYTQNIIQLLQLSIVFVVIIIKYLYKLINQL